MKLEFTASAVVPAIVQVGAEHASVIPFVLGIVTEDAFCQPDCTLIVSPLAAFVMQALTLDWSIVEVQVGLVPVQEAWATEEQRRTVTTTADNAIGFLNPPPWRKD